MWKKKKKKHCAMTKKLQQVVHENQLFLFTFYFKAHGCGKEKFIFLFSCVSRV